MFNCSVEYDKLAEMYDAYYAPNWPFDDSTQGLIDYLKTRPGGKNILEIGIGTGNVSGKLYLAGYHKITGIDASKKMTERLKYKCPGAKLIIQELNETEFYNYDWILMVGGITERVEDKLTYFKKMYKQIDVGTQIFIDVGSDVTYKENVDPNDDLSYTFFNAKRNMHVSCKYNQITPSHHKGTFLYTQYTEHKKTTEIFYNYSMWEITQTDLIDLMKKIGFVYLETCDSTHTGYYQDILAFQK